MNSKKWGIFLCGVENDINEAHVEKLLVVEMDDYADAEVYVETTYLDKRDYFIIRPVWKNREPSN